MRADTSGAIQIYSYFNAVNTMNSYLIWHKGNTAAILIDPVLIDISLFEIITGNNLEITAIFLTDTHNHPEAVRTIPSIYPDVLFYGSGTPDDSPTGADQGGMLARLGCTVEPLFISGGYSDSITYRVNNFLFTGEILSAGRALEDNKILIRNIKETLFTLPDHTIIFPLYGPPSTIGIEKVHNIVVRG